MCAYIQKRKYTGKTALAGKGEDEAGPSWEQEEEPERTTQSLHNIQKDCSSQPNEPVVTWLLPCWDMGASSLELEGREAKQLGSLSREVSIDRVIRRLVHTLSLWRWLLAGVKEIYPTKDDIKDCSGRWTTMEKSIQDLIELPVLEKLNRTNESPQPVDPDEVVHSSYMEEVPDSCTTIIWQLIGCVSLGHERWPRASSG